MEVVIYHNIWSLHLLTLAKIPLAALPLTFRLNQSKLDFE
jgi:hypothetical protein